MHNGTSSYAWRGSFNNTEINRLHAEAFDTRVFDNEEWDWVRQVQTYPLGWVVARTGDRLVGFDEELRPFYIDACGFEETSAGLMKL